MKIAIEIPDDLQEEEIYAMLEEISEELRNKTVDDEQMDGSIRFDTEHGVAFLTID